MFVRIKLVVCLGLLLFADGWGVFAQPKRAGIVYSTLLAKTGEYVRIQDYGADASHFFLKDVNGDGRDDAVIYHASGPNIGKWSVAWSDGQWLTNVTSSAAMIASNANLKPFMGDVNGDQRQDACLYEPDTGNWLVALSDGTGFGAFTLFATNNGVASSSQFLVDVNGDGRADLVVCSSISTTRNWYVSLSTGDHFASPMLWLTNAEGDAGQYLIGDVNGDGRADAVVFSPNSGNWLVALAGSNGFGDLNMWRTNFGTNAETVFLHDVDRNGRADAVYIRQSDSDWWVSYSTGSSFVSNHRWIAGLNVAYPKEGFPAPQAKLLGTINGTTTCACAVTLGDWFALENTNKNATVGAGDSDTWSSWGNNYIPQWPGAPGTYDSGDAARCDLLIAELHDAGFDYVMFDITNGRHDWVDSRARRFVERIRAWNTQRSAGQRPMYFCVAMGGSRGKSDFESIIEAESQRTWEEFYSTNRDIYYTLNGQPLLVHFVWDPSYSSNFLAWAGVKTYANRFTIRWMYNSIYNIPANANAYGWIVREKGGNPVGNEVMDVMPGFWNGNLFINRDAGDFYGSQWRRVIQHQPDSVWVNSLNESWEHTSVEPSWLHGRWKANAALSQWDDTYGERTDDFYWQMTRAYNRLFRFNQLLEGDCFTEGDASEIYRTENSEFVLQSVPPHGIPVLQLPAEFRANFTGQIVASNAVSSSAPDSRYGFNENAGNVAEDSLGGFSGYLSNGVVRVAGLEGMAVQCDGVDDFVSFPQEPTADFSLAFWVRTTASGNATTNWWEGKILLASAEASATNGVGVALLGDKCVLGISASTGATAIALRPINDGLWHRIVATRDMVTGQMSLYLDGVLEARTYAAAGLLPYPTTLRLGGGVAISNSVAADFDLVEIFNSCLSPFAVAPTNLITSAWILDGNSVWSNSSAWENGLIANGAGTIAGFDLPLMASTRTVTLDANRTVGGLVFGNRNSFNGGNWSISGASSLTFENFGYPPEIACWPLRAAGNSAVTFNTPLVGSAGLLKTGTGTLWLAGNNTGLSGMFSITAGRVFNNSATGLGRTSVYLAKGTYLSFWKGGMFTNDIHLNGMGQSQDGQIKSALYADANNAVVTLNGTVWLNSTSDIGTSGNPTTGETGFVVLNGIITGAGGLVKNGTSKMYGPLTLGAGAVADYVGPTLVSNGVLAVDTTLTASRVTNYSDTILVGSGWIAAGATLLRGAVLSPGRTNQAGTLAIGNLICHDGATMVFNLNPTNYAPEAGNDLLLVTNLTVAGVTTNRIDFGGDSIPGYGRRVLIRYSGTAIGLTNLVLLSAMKEPPYQLFLDCSIPGEVAAVVPAPVPPPLYARLGTNATCLTLAWPDWAVGYSVYFSTNLSTTERWRRIPNVPQAVPPNFEMIISITNTSSGFFRLVSP